jgi:putative flippase GtrA
MDSLLDHPVFIQFLHFCIVGVLGVSLDFFITWVLKEKMHWRKYLANSTAFIMGTSMNYALNRHWTFHSTDPNLVEQYLTFMLIGAIGLGINNLIVLFLHSKKEQNFYLAKFFAIGVVVLWNFFANYSYTFQS